MARLPRILPANVPVHVIQLGNNRQVCLAAEKDYAAYTDGLAPPHSTYLALSLNDTERRAHYLIVHCLSNLLAMNCW